MHGLSDRNRSEFLAVPDLVRLTVAHGANDPEATLLIKTSTFRLKCLTLSSCLRLALIRIASNWLAYGIEVHDDPAHPFFLWSILEFDDEFRCLHTLTKDSSCVVFLFNEAAVSVAWADVHIDLSLPISQRMINSSSLHPKHEKEASIEVHHKIEMMQQQIRTDNIVVFNLPRVLTWHPIDVMYYSNRNKHSLISIFNGDEGGQQEELAVWLTDNQHPKGTVKSPQIHEPRQPRELSDLLFYHEYGSFLIESKTLSLLKRETLPNRAKLASNLIKHLDKATHQLIGGVRNIKRGYKVTDQQGEEVEIERSMPSHVIILVPDLSLLSDATKYGADFIRIASLEINGFFHILDPAELLRIVQAAGMIAARNTSIMLLMAFDYYLMERAEIATNKPTPNFEVLLRFSDEFPPLGF